MSPKHNTRLKPSWLYAIVLLLLFAVWIYDPPLFKSEEVAPTKLVATEVVVPTLLPPAVQGLSTETPNHSPFQIFITNPETDQTGKTVELHLIDYIDQSKTSIDVAYFELDLENLTQALIRAKKRGISVRFVYDNEHSDPDPQTKKLLDAGIVGIKDGRDGLMHNKFFIIDSECVWTGSFNYTVNASTKNNEDAVYVCSHELAENYTKEFTEMFNGEFGTTSPDDTPNPIIFIDGIKVENYFASEGDTLGHIIDEVSLAKQSVHFMAFSLTDDKLGDQMILKSLYGLDVKGVFESRLAPGQGSECPRLSAAHLPVKLDGNKQTFHHKVIIIDSSTVIFGSFNFSESAEKNNDENIIIAHDPWLANQFEKEFAKQYTLGSFPANTTCK